MFLHLLSLNLLRDEFFFPMARNHTWNEKGRPETGKTIPFVGGGSLGSIQQSLRGGTTKQSRGTSEASIASLRSQ